MNVKELIILDKEENLKAAFDFEFNTEMREIQDRAIFMIENPNHQMSQRYWEDVKDASIKLFKLNEKYKIKAIG